MTIRLDEKPFDLTDEQIAFVEKTVEEMTLDEKIGQLFLPINFIQDPAELTAFVQKYHPAGLLNRPAPAARQQESHRVMQKASRIPLFIAANIESGGNGAVVEGTAFGNPLQIAATDDEAYARELGRICAEEARAVGVNYAFAPVTDLDLNPLNPITNTRTFGSDPDRVRRMVSAYMDGMEEACPDMCYSIKHFPGDGVDHRDQHLHTTYNTLSVEEWEQTYGRNYRHYIEKGAKSFMVGHIGLPEYVKKLNPAASKKEILAPGSLSREIMTDLLRGELGFNGVIITDSTSMNGFYAHMSRREAVPTAIKNGADLFLFNFSMEEDFGYMKAAVVSGILPMERVEEAITRTIAMKVSLGLFEEQEKDALVPGKEEIQKIGTKRAVTLARECAERAVTLVKDEQKNLPLNPALQHRIMLYIMGDREDFYGNQKVGDLVMTALRREGFEVDLFDYSVHIPDPNKTMQEFLNRYDAAIYVLSEGTSSNQTTVRLTWNLPLANDAPWFVNDIPTVAVSFANPYHLRDMPEVKTFINAYTTSPDAVEAVIDKLLGRSPFTGVSPVDPTCGLYELNLRNEAY